MIWGLMEFKEGCTRHLRDYKTKKYWGGVKAPRGAWVTTKLDDLVAQAPLGIREGWYRISEGVQDKEQRGVVLTVAGRRTT